MRSTVIALILVVLTQPASRPATPTGPMAAIEELSELYKKELTNGDEIVVVRKEVPLTASLRRLLKRDGDAAASLKLFLISAELHSPKATPVVLGTKLQWGPASPSPTTTVLNVVAEQGEVVVAMSTWIGIGLWRIQLDRLSDDTFTWLPAGWEVRAEARPTTKESIQVSLERRDDGRWAVAVRDVSLDRPVSPSRYQQDADGWKFHLTQRWSDAEANAPGRPRKR